MLKLLLSILALQVFFLSPMVSGNGIAIVESSVKSQSSKVNKNPSETDGPKTASFLQLMIARRPLKGNSSKLFHGGSADGACRKVDMIVNPSDLGLFVRVLFPQNFNAYQCKGKCDLKELHKFNDHSLIKAWLNSKNTSNTTDGTEACCVPVKSRSQSLLYVSDKGSIAQHTFNDMVVEECGCR